MGSLMYMLPAIYEMLAFYRIHRHFKQSIKYMRIIIYILYSRHYIQYLHILWKDKGFWGKVGKKVKIKILFKTCAFLKKYKCYFETIKKYH